MGRVTSFLRQAVEVAFNAGRGLIQATGITQQLLTHAVVWVSGVLVGALVVGAVVVACSGGR